MSYKHDIMYDNFRQTLFSIDDKGLESMLEDVFNEIKRRAYE